MASRQFRARPSHGESGQILVLTTVSMIALMGIMALTLDASFMFEKRNRLHAVADAAAKSAAIEVVRNPSVSQASLEAFADQQALAHGFVSTRQSGTTSVVINRPPTSGTFAGNVSYVEAVVSEVTSTFFAKIVGWTNMTPLATAVAGAGNPSSCMIIEDDLTIGNTSLTMNGCGVAVGDDLAGTNPNATIGGTPPPDVGVGGTCTGTCTGMGNLTLGVPPPDDPLAGLAAPAMPAGGCTPGVAATLVPDRCYSSIGPTVTTLPAGLYYVTGPIVIKNLTGTGVLIYVAAGGSLASDNNNDALHLTAATTGPYSGIAIFQERTNTSNFDARNNFLIDVRGVIYMPGTDVEFENALTFTNTGCTLFIAKSLDIRNGNGVISNSNCASTFGSASFLSASIAR
jgi:Flp pilus assembly protein TadG